MGYSRLSQFSRFSVQTHGMIDYTRELGSSREGAPVATTALEDLSCVELRLPRSLNRPTSNTGSQHAPRLRCANASQNQSLVAEQGFGYCYSLPSRRPVGSFSRFQNGMPHQQPKHHPTLKLKLRFKGAFTTRRPAKYKLAPGSRVLPYRGSHGARSLFNTYYCCTYHSCSIFHITLH